MTNKKLTESFDRIRLDPARAEQIWLRAEAAHTVRAKGRVVSPGKLLRVALIAALLSAFFISSAYALSCARGTGTYPMRHDVEYRSLRDLPKAEKILGYPVTVPEGLSGGYCFLKMHIGGEAVFDENNAVLQSYYGLHVQYGAPDKKPLYLNLSPVLALNAGRPQPTETRALGGVEVCYSRDHYKYVPEDYQKTAEDLAAEAAGHFYLSFGADAVEEQDLEFADFVLDGVNYVLMDENGDGPEALFRMAAEVIDAQSGEVAN